MSCCCQNHCQSQNQTIENKKNYFSQSKLLIISVISLIASYFTEQYFSKFEQSFFLNFAWITLFICGYPIFCKGIKFLLVEKKITSALLITISISAAICLAIFQAFIIASGDNCSQYIFAAAEVAFLMRLGSFIENKTVEKSRSKINDLAKLIPDTALIKQGNSHKKVCISKVSLSDTLCVLPNTLFPLDGTIVSGQTQADESNLTGESMPVEKEVNSKVYAGTMNLSGYVEIKANKLAKDSQISKIAKIVNEASGKNSQISRYADKWASKIIPLAILFSILTFFITKFVLDISTLQACIRSVTILIVFCPCAFVLATPTAIAAGLGNAAKKGLLIKSGFYLEKLANVNSVFFDKTGTLTKENIEVSEVLIMPNFEREYVLTNAAMAEKLSDHPIAKAIYSYINMQVDNPEEIYSTISKGVKAKCKGNVVELSSCENSEFSKSGLSCIQMKINNNICAYFYIKASLRPSAKEAIKQLDLLNIKTTILSGDKSEIVKEVANELEIKNYHSSLLPEDKLKLITKAQKNNDKICMVGDGVNDSPALATAYSSIAIASLNSSVATQTAQSSIAGENLKLIPYAIYLSRKVIKKIKVNILFSIIWNLIVLALAFTGKIDPVWGAFLHNISSIFVVLNSASLLNLKDIKIAD